MGRTAWRKEEIVNAVPEWGSYPLVVPREGVVAFDDTLCATLSPSRHQVQAHLVTPLMQRVTVIQDTTRERRHMRHIAGAI